MIFYASLTDKLLLQDNRVNTHANSRQDREWAEEVNRCILRILKLRIHLEPEDPIYPYVPKNESDWFYTFSRLISIFDDRWGNTELHGQTVVSFEKWMSAVISWQQHPCTEEYIDLYRELAEAKEDEARRYKRWSETILGRWNTARSAQRDPHSDYAQWYNANISHLTEHLAAADPNIIEPADTYSDDLGGSDNDDDWQRVMSQDHSHGMIGNDEEISLENMGFPLLPSSERIGGQPSRNLDSSHATEGELRELAERTAEVTRLMATFDSLWRRIERLMRRYESLRRRNESLQPGSDSGDLPITVDRGSSDPTQPEPSNDE